MDRESFTSDPSPPVRREPESRLRHGDEAQQDTKIRRRTVVNLRPVPGWTQTHLTSSLQKRNEALIRAFNPRADHFMFKERRQNGPLSENNTELVQSTWLGTSSQCGRPLSRFLIPFLEEQCGRLGVGAGQSAGL